jgi:peptide/nickel transport system permease protein
MHPLAIAFREILPNALTPVISLAAIIAAAAVLIEAALSFLGFGDPNRPSWGGMVAEGRAMLRSAPSLSLIPGLALVLIVLAIHLLGRGYAKALRVREPVA